MDASGDDKGAEKTRSWSCVRQLAGLQRSPGTSERPVRDLRSDELEDPQMAWLKRRRENANLALQRSRAARQMEFLPLNEEMVEREVALLEKAWNLLPARELQI
jgi:hypothetical protein